MKDRIFVPLIIAVSVLVPVLVILLMQMPAIEGHGLNLTIFPLVNACINSAVSVLLVLGYVLIRRRQIAQHKAVMLTAFVLSALFLVNYVVYHLLSPDQARYGGEGAIRYVYFLLLITHVLLAALILPAILFTVYRGLQGDYARHRRIARWTFPLWLYVSVTGVVVYLMMAPYYSH